MTFDTPTMRQAAYRARCALCSAKGVDGYLKKVLRHAPVEYVALVRAFVDVLPPLMVGNCIAQAEHLAIEQLQKEPHDQSK